MNKQVSEKYKMKAGYAPGEYRHKGVTIDTTKCTLEELEEAIKNGFDLVEPVKAESSKNK